MATYSISGNVFLDQNGDSIYESGDVVQSVSTVTLYSAAGQKVVTGTTDAYGNYSFSGIANGNYYVQFTAPSGDVFSPVVSGLSQEDGAGLSSAGKTGVFAVSGANVTDINAGFYAPVTVSGTVFQDNNDNGQFDGADAGIGGVTVSLLNAAGAPTGQTATTAANGTYSFTNLAPGTYSVQVAQSATPGAVFSPLGSNTAPQPTGGTPTTAANLLVNGNFNANGATGNAAVTQGLSGWTVSANTTATPYGGGPGKGVEIAATNGSTAVSYQPGGGTNTYEGVIGADSANPNYYGGPVNDAAFFVDDSAIETLSQTVTLTAGQVYEIGFDLAETTPGKGNPGFFQLTAAINGQVITTAGSVSGTILTPGVWTHFADLYTPTTSGPVTLTFTYSSGVGVASKDVLVDDVYVVPGQQTPNLTTTSEVNTAGITAPVTLTSGQSVGNESAGIYLPAATISGTVFTDANGDGAQQTGEGGLSGVTVELIKSGVIINSTQTIAGGSYSFNNVGAGSYSVTVLAPSGDKFSPAGSSATLTDSTVGSNGSQTISVINGGTGTVNAGLYAPSTVSGSVFLDSNADGTKQGTEGAASGVTVQLLNGSTVLATTTTGSNGSYSFTGVAPGSDTVKITAPTGDLISTNGGAASLPVTVTSGSTDSVAATGLYANASVSGTVFGDLNADGSENGADAGIAGQTVQLISGGNVVGTATTGANGSYTINNVTPGSYTVKVLPVAGDQFSTNGGSGSQNVTLTSGGSATVNGGEFAPGHVGGTVFADANADGVQQGGETGAAGVTVQLLNGSTVLATTTTGSDGSYSFANVLPGNDTVKVVAPGGDLFSTNGGSGSQGVTITSGSSATVNAGLFADAALSGVVFADRNANGTQDAGDAGLSGQVVDLLSGSTVMASATTGTNGSYSFSGIKPGSYTVQVEAAPGTLFSTNAGSGSESLTLSSSQTASFNAGEFTKATLGGTVFLDANADGVEGAGESGLGGVSVQLLNASGAPILGETTTTAADGSYSFAGLLPGSYGVQVTPPSGLTMSPIGTAAAPAIDNLANAAGVIAPVALLSGQTDLALNAGVARTGKIESFVFFDGQADGIYHVGDAGVAGVTVKLFDSTGTLVATTTTDSEGGYGFGALAAGQYHVQVVAPQGTAFSAQEHASGNTLLDSDVNASGVSDNFTVIANGTVTGVNAGLVLTGHFAGSTPVVLGSGQSFSSNGPDGVVVVGSGNDNVHGAPGGNNVIVLGGSGNVIENGPSASTDIGVSAGSLNAQNQNAAQGYLFAGGGGSVLNGGTGFNYLIGGTGANQLFGGAGNNVLIAGGSGSDVVINGTSTKIVYQAGDGQLTIDNMFTSADSLAIYGYSSGTFERVNGQEELVLSATDIIRFNSSTVFTNGQTSGGQGVSFDANLLDAPTLSLSFNAQGLPVFTVSTGSTALGSATPAPAAPPAPVATISGPQNGGDVVVQAGTSVVHLSGHGNTLSAAAGFSGDLSIDGDQGNSVFTLGNGNNTLVLGGYDDQITLGNGDSHISGTQGNATISVGNSGSQGGVINAGGYGNVITTRGGEWTIAAGDGAAQIATGAASDTVSLNGYGNSLSVSTGHDVVSGGLGETIYSVTDFAAAGPAVASLDITGFSIQQRDSLDLSGVLSQAGYNGSNLANLLTIQAANGGADTQVFVAKGGVNHLVADLHNVSAANFGIGHGLAV